MNVVTMIKKRHKSYLAIIAAAGSTPNLDMRVLQSSLDPVFRADLCIVEISISRLLRCRNSGGERPGGVREKSLICVRVACKFIFASFSDSGFESDFIQQNT
jgi:hypothetical protein